MNRLLLSITVFATFTYAQFASGGPTVNPPQGPEDYKLNYTSSEVRKIGKSRVKLLKESSTLKVNRCLLEWQKYETPNLVYPPAFTYGLQKATAVFPFVQQVIFAAVDADKYVKKAAEHYEVDLKLLKTKQEVVEATFRVYSNAGFGYEGSEDDNGLEKFANRPLVKKVLSVFAKTKKRSLYGGIVTVKTANIDYEAEVIIIVDLDANEVSGIAHGDLFKFFDRSSDDEG